jgi:hypothetical protein
MVRQPIQQGGGHFGIAEHTGPFGKGQVGGDGCRSIKTSEYACN